MVDTLTDPKLDLAKELAEHFIDPDQYGKLGAHVGGGDPRIPLLARHVESTKPFPLPVACHRDYSGWKYGMLANDRLGDCVVAEMYHGWMHLRRGAGLKLPDADTLTPGVVKVYSAIGGYVEGDPSTDNGLMPTDAYHYWRDTGLLLPDGSRDKIDGMAQVLPHDGSNIKRSIVEFDCIGISLSMPAAWQQASIWDTGADPSQGDWQPGSWGGHQVLGISYDRYGVIVVTWGGLMRITWRALGTYGELVLVQLSKDILNQKGLSEYGVNYATLCQDLPVL